MHTTITSVSSIYTYHTDRKSWKNSGFKEHYCISYQLSGQYDHEFSFDVLPVKKDTLFLINKNNPYSVRCKEPGKSICVTFSGESKLSTMILDCADYPKIKNSFLKLLQYKNLQSESNYCDAMSVLYEILSFIHKKSSPEYVSSDIKAKVQFSRNFILENYMTSDLSTSALAKQCGITPKYFSTVFKRLYNSTPTQYIINLRLKSASELLMQSTFNINEIAEMVGFSDIYYFSKLFKKRFSCSPKEFRSLDCNK